MDPLFPVYLELLHRHLYCRSICYLESVLIGSTEAGTRALAGSVEGSGGRRTLHELPRA